MGKGVALAEEEEEALQGSRCWRWLKDSGICRKSTVKWVVAMVVSIQLLVFAVLSLPGLHRQEKAGPGAPPPGFSQPQVLATFELQLPATRLNASLAELQRDLEMEIGVNQSLQLQLYIIKVDQTGGGGDNSTVTFAVLPASGSGIGTPGIDQLREVLISIFLNETRLNITLGSSDFGQAEASEFQILKFPGGLTIWPDRGGAGAGSDSGSVVLFNFTLDRSMVSIVRNFHDLQAQISSFTRVGAKETVVIELTNEAGSTVRSPVEVQVSVASAIPGKPVPQTRLDQLAQQLVDRSKASNLGLNLSLFGNVQGFNLSSALVQHLIPAPAPSPGPAAPPRPRAPPSPRPRKPPPPPPSPPPPAHSPPAPSWDLPPSTSPDMASPPLPPPPLPGPGPGAASPPAPSPRQDSPSPSSASALLPPPDLLMLLPPAVLLAAFLRM